MLSYGVLLVGVWRAIRFAEFGRAVAEERARVAREIHDGLAQYLFAISTHASMLAGGATPSRSIRADQGGGRGRAAGGAVRRPRALLGGRHRAVRRGARRYVDFLTADGQLEVELEIERGVALAPDEQIEVFRIVQEGLANVRKHAGARRADVLIGVRER